MVSYLSPYLKAKELAKIVSQAAVKIERRFPECDTIAVRGNSGLLVGAPLAIHLKKNLLIVRKDNEKSHSDLKVEGVGKNQKILIVDDFMETGTTVDLIYEECFGACDSPTFLGIFLYASRSKNVIGSETYTHPDGTKFTVRSIYRGNK